MLTLIVKWMLLSLSLMLTAWMVPGIILDGLASAMFAAIVIGFINLFIRPLVLFFTLPINLLTLGLFTFIVNALLLQLAGLITPGMAVEGFLSAFIGSLIISFLSMLINWTTSPMQHA